MRNLLQRSHFLRLVKRRLYPSPRDEAVVGTVPLGFHHSRGRVSHWRVFETDYDEEFAHAWRTTEAILLRFAERCRRDGVQLVVFAFPLVESDDEWRPAA